LNSVLYGFYHIIFTINYHFQYGNHRHIKFISIYYWLFFFPLESIYRKEGAYLSAQT
jgi:hypothetical protein